MAPVEENWTGEMKIVCVTGASGYIASWIVKLLLQRGYTVRGSVRDLNDPKKTEHLLALDGAKERLHLFKANLMEDGSFDSAIDGCVGVFHTASPCYYTPQDPQTELLDPAVKGTLNVLGSCAKAPSVRRVILTSSLAAMIVRKEPPTPDTVADESWFSDPEACKTFKMWYFLAKTLAEEAAWKFVKDKGIDMVTINPGYTIGPLLQPTINFSVLAIYNYIAEAEPVPAEASYWVHVKDVAEAHIRAFEKPEANGRYGMVESGVPYPEIVKILRELYPALRLRKECIVDGIETPCQVSKEKAKSLGINFIPLETSLKETVESLKEKKLVSF